MLLKIILGSNIWANIGAMSSINQHNEGSEGFCCLVYCFVLFCLGFSPQKYSKLCNFALSKTEEEHRNDWRLVFKAGMGLILVTMTFET